MSGDIGGKMKLCINRHYMSYGFLSPHALCAQPPQSCQYETWELLTLKTGRRVQQFYCTFTTEEVPIKQKKQKARAVSMEELAEHGCKPGGT